MSYGLNRLSKPPIPNGQRLAFRVGTGCWDVTVGRGGGCCNGTCSGSQSSALKFHTPCVSSTPAGVSQQKINRHAKAIENALRAQRAEDGSVQI
ncbi:MAG: hypothetical protein ACOY45_01485 [Pseudomonadota bacterium]